MDYSTQTNWYGIAIIFIGGIAAATALGKAPPAAFDLQGSLQLSLTQIGWVMSVATIASCLLGPVSGQLSHWRGARNLLRDGLLILVLAGALSALASSAEELILGRSIEGIGVIFVTVAAPTLIANLARPQDLGIAMAVWAPWMPAGNAIMLTIGPSLLALFHWKGLWLVSSAIALMALILLRRIPKSVGIPSRTKLDVSVLRRGAPWWLAGSFFCFTSQFFGVFTFLPLHLAHTQGLEPTAASFATALVPASTIPGNLFGGVLVHRGWPATRLLWLPALGLMLLLPLVLLAPHKPPLTYLLLPLYGFTLGMIPTGIFTLAPRLAPIPPATGPIIGLALSGQGLGILLGPPTIGMLVERTGGWEVPLGLLWGILAFLLVCAKALSKEETRGA